MEVDKSFSYIRNVLIKLENSLSVKLKYISLSDEASIDSVIEELRQCDFFNRKDENYLRKIHFSLLLNTDIALRNLLAEDHNCGYIVDIFPILSASLYFVIVVEFELLLYLKETILYAPIALVVEVLNTLKDKRKYVTLEQHVHFNYEILNAIFRRLRNLDATSEVGISAEVRTSAERTFVYFFRTFALSFSSDKLTARFPGNEEKTCEHKGYVFYYLLRLLKECAATSSEPSVASCKETVDIYNIDTLVDCASFWSPVLPAEMITDPLLVCYELLASYCEIALCELDVGEFAELYDIRYDESKSLQLIIREEVNKLLSVLRDNPNVPDTFRSCFSVALMQILESFSVPHSEQDVQCNSNEEPTNDEDDNVVSDRISSLLSDGTLIYDVEAISYIADGNMRLNDDDTETLMRLIVREAIAKKEELKNRRLLGDLVVAILKTLSCVQASNLFRNISSEYGLVDLRVLVSRDIMYILEDIRETLCTDDPDGSENAESVDDKISILKKFIIVGIFNLEEALLSVIKYGVEHWDFEPKAIIKVIEMTCIDECEYSNQKSSISCLFRILQNITENVYPLWGENEREKFVPLIRGLVGNNIVTGELVMSEYFLKSLNANEIKSELLVHTTAILNAFIKSVDLSEYKCQLLDVLIRLANIMEATRDSINNFTIRYKTLCDDVGETIETILIELPLSASDQYVLTSGLESCSIFTKSYFWALYDGANLDWETRMVFLMRIQNYNVDSDLAKKRGSQLVLVFSKIFVRCTCLEVQNFIRNIVGMKRLNALHVMCLLCDSLSIMSNFASAEATNAQSPDVDNIIEWFNYVLNIFLRVMQNVFIPLLIDGDSKFIVSCIHHAIQAANKISEKSESSPRMFNLLKCIYECFPVIQSTSSDITTDVGKLAICLLMSPTCNVEKIH